MQSCKSSITFQHRKSSVLQVEFSALEKIRSLSSASFESETGGILVGFNRGHDILVTDASDAGPNARRSATHFLRDTQHCRQFLRQSFECTGADYVGEWHTHIVPLDRLSFGDLGTVARIFVDPDYDFESFAVMLPLVRRNSIELSAYVAERVPGRARSIVLTEVYRGAFPQREANDDSTLDGREK